MNKLKKILYSYLVKSNGYITYSYEIYISNHLEEHHNIIKKIYHWFVLIKLNYYYSFQYPLIQNLKVNNLYTQSIIFKNINHILDSESQFLSKRGSPYDFAKSLLSSDIIVLDLFNILVFPLSRYNKKFCEFLFLNGSINNQIYVNEYVYTVLSILKSLGKKVIYFDNYNLPSRLIRNLLNIKNLDHLGEYNINITDRQDLYILLSNKYGDDRKINWIINPENVKKLKIQKANLNITYYLNVNYVGANYRVFPSGMSTANEDLYSFIINTTLHSGMQKYTFLYEYGFIYGGIYLAGVSSWMNHHIKSLKFSEAWIMYNDGEIYDNYFSLFYPEIHIKKFLWSHMTYIKFASINDSKIFFLWLKKQKNVTIYKLLEVLNLNILYEKIKKAGFTKYTLINKSNFHNICTIFKQNWNIICSSFKNEQNIAQTYFSYLFDSKENIVLITSGQYTQELMFFTKLIVQEWQLLKNIFILNGCNLGTVSDYPIFTNSKVQYFGNYQKHRNSYFKTIFSLFHLHESMLFTGWSTQNLKMSYLFSMFDTYNHVGLIEIQKAMIVYCQKYNLLTKNHKVNDINSYEALFPALFISQNRKYCTKLLKKLNIQQLC
ncbi:MAG: hypothetical protein Q4C69_09220 [Lachnoclostridium edouardi]|uniref:hypothetical protein n=1 Tax=Lachnoclostridium edouardi TaxID=1926283 RepID=UPI0026DB7256|nr:hypothetical protein [Lachnoclostridium edouardi]MDO4278995.1 hypothetical protein [Lachnoclostridium edouardi]